MFKKSIIFTLALSIAAVSIARADETPVHFVLPTSTARTLQVTELLWSSGNDSQPKLLRPMATIKISVKRPDRFRMEGFADSPGSPPCVMVTNGPKSASFDGKRWGPLTDEWLFPGMELLTPKRRPLTAIPTVREGKPILLLARSFKEEAREIWFDPKTHLPIRESMFQISQGKSTEIMRGCFSNWVLNAPIPASTFRVPKYHER